MLDTPTTNRHLVEAAADPADEVTWMQLHSTYAKPIGRLCRQSGLNPSECDEVANQVFVKLSQRLSKSGFAWSSGTLRGWLSEIANRLIFETHRLNRQREFTPDALILIQEWLPSALAPMSESVSREKLEVHLWSVCLSRVRSAVPSNKWQIFESYTLQGNSSAVVARTFNVTQINVRIIRMRMITRIRREWANLAQQQIDAPE